MGQWRNIDIHFNWLSHKALSKSLKGSLVGSVFWRRDWFRLYKETHKFRLAWQKEKRRMSEAGPTTACRKWVRSIAGKEPHCTANLRHTWGFPCDGSNEPLLRAPIFNVEAHLPQPTPWNREKVVVVIENCLSYGQGKLFSRPRLWGLQEKRILFSL